MLYSSFLAYLGGVVVGVIVTLIFQYLRTAHGYFKLEPYDEDDTGFYKVNIRIPSEANLLHTDKIILHKEESQK